MQIYLSSLGIFVPSYGITQSQREKGYERLFQELYHTAKKGYGQAYGKRYNDNKKTWLDKETLIKLKNKEILLDLDIILAEA